MRYFITFRSYGSHLHGSEVGSVDRHHNQFGGRFAEPDVGRVEAEFRHMNEPPYLLDRRKGGVVLEALREVCAHRGWVLLAAHVRGNHVHVVVEADVQPEKVMIDFKAYASRGLNRIGRGLNRIESPRRRWARYGSTRWLWKDDEVRRAIRYVVGEQGEPMAVFLGTDV